MTDILSVFRHGWTAAALMLMLVVCSCNIDGEYEALPKPEIRFDHDDGIYTVKVGGTLTLAPDVTNGDDMA